MISVGRNDQTFRGIFHHKWMTCVRIRSTQDTSFAFQLYGERKVCPDRAAIYSLSVRRLQFEHARIRLREETHERIAGRHAGRTACSIPARRCQETECAEHDWQCGTVQK